MSTTQGMLLTADVRRAIEDERDKYQLARSRVIENARQLRLDGGDTPTDRSLPEDASLLPWHRKSRSLSREGIAPIARDEWIIQRAELASVLEESVAKKGLSEEAERELLKESLATLDALRRIGLLDEPSQAEFDASSFKRRLASMLSPILDATKLTSADEAKLTGDHETESQSTAEES